MVVEPLQPIPRLQHEALDDAAYNFVYRQYQLHGKPPLPPSTIGCDCRQSIAGPERDDGPTGLGDRSSGKHVRHEEIIIAFC